MDLRKALNAVSDVVANRPPAIREFDQIYMKHADLLIQTELVSKWFSDRDVVFVGDGDAVGLCLTYLHSLGELQSGPRRVLVIDFDERVVNSVDAFAARYSLKDKISAQLYNVADSFPQELWGSFNAFYTNPPFGAINSGISIRSFLLRGLEACNNDCLGCVVLADSAKKDPKWVNEVLFNVQKFILDQGCITAEMIPKLHTYHLDDDPTLTSCSIIFKRIRENAEHYCSNPLKQADRKNFYGTNRHLEVRYVRDSRERSEMGFPISSEYQIEYFDKLLPTEGTS
jgi:predicted methyltransferase